MGFIDENGQPIINEEHKVRITLSERARLTISEDMDIFKTPKITTFLNTVFDNYKLEAKSSITLYLQQRKLELDRIFTHTQLDSSSKKIAIDQLLSHEEKELIDQLAEYSSTKGESKLYHLNNSNVTYLEDVCEENLYYKRPGIYIRSVIEEYCSLPFIKRERIYKKNVYDIVERACREKRILKIKTPYYGKEQLFYVYPYKIVPDSFHTQSYLVCYSRKAEDEEKDKIIASFSMARLMLPTMMTKTFYLNKQEIANIESQISNYSAAYLVGTPDKIKVRLTPKGKQSYQSRIYSRPDKLISASDHDDTYIFDCTHQQIFNYFFSFGADAEILQPESLRNRFKKNYRKAIENYEDTSSE